MEEVGNVIHLAKSGRLIIKVDRWIKLGTVLFDSSGKKLAKVTELIGPVKSPYVTAIPLTKNVKRIAGNKVMINMKRGMRIAGK